MTTVVQESLAAGATLAGLWVVERPLVDLGGVRAALARGVESGRAIVFVLPPAAPDPVLHEDEEALWGVSRRVLRDPGHGRIVVDEIPEGPLLAERLALGLPLVQGLIDELSRRARASHRAGRAHGQIAPDRIVLGTEGPAVAGWGLLDTVEQRGDRDLASLRQLASVVASTATGPVTEAVAEEAGDGEPPAAERSAPASGPALAAVTVRLQAAIVSSHLPTLRAALEEWRSGDGAGDDPTARRAEDALARLERRISESLAEARRRLEAGDPLGAVAPCREAVRLGAEPEAAPLLREARRQAQQVVNIRRPIPWRSITTVGGGALAFVLLVVAAVVALAPGGETGELRRQAEEIAARDGERAAAVFLVSRRETGDRTRALDEILADRLEELVVAERRRLTQLRADAAERGARPREADQAAEDALSKLADLAAGAVGHEASAQRLRRVFEQLDNAARMYRSAVGISPERAARAVERLLAQDPVFSVGRDSR